MALPTQRRNHVQDTPQRTGPNGGSDPISDFETLQRQTLALLRSAWGGGPAIPVPAVWVPPVDVEETEDAWIVEAELPGVRKKDVDVRVDDGELVIEGEIVERERKGILRRRTRRAGRFEYRVALPGLDTDAIDAHLDKGVLTVRVPKSDRDRSRRVDIRSGDDSG
jgi:HSP20 family protein